MHVFSPEKYKEYSADLSENRELAKIENVNLFNSGDTLSAYIDDHAPFRSLLIGWYQKLDGKAEVLYSRAVSAISGMFSDKDSGNTEVVDLDSFFNEKETTVSIPIPETLPVEPVKEHEHEYSVTDALDPDCEMTGYKLYTCNGCGDYYTEILDALGHDGKLTKESKASYTTYGFKEYTCQRCGAVYRTDIEAKLIDTSYFAPRKVGEGMLYGRNEWLFYTGNNSISYYKGTNLLEDEKLMEYETKTNRLNELCKGRGIELYLLFCPNKEQVYSEYMPTYEVSTDYKRTSRLVDYLNEKTDVKSVYPLEELKAADFYWQTYYKYDTHWNKTGAFIALQALYRAMGKETTNPLELKGEFVPAELILGFVLAGLDAANFSPDTEIHFEYKPEVTLEGVNEKKNVCRITSDSTNDEKIVMLGDSFRIQMLAYLAKDFSKTTIAHRDYAASCKKDILQCDILVLEAVERYDARTFTLMDTLIEYLEEAKAENK